MVLDPVAHRHAASLGWPRPGCDAGGHLVPVPLRPRRKDHIVPIEAGQGVLDQVGSTDKQDSRPGPATLGSSWGSQPTTGSPRAVYPLLAGFLAGRG